MEKNLLVGNGINLPACDSDELLTALNKCRDILTNIKQDKPKEEFLFLLMEIDRISKQYREFQMLFLDAIYDEGNINSLDYGFKFRDFVSAYDNEV